LPGDGRIAPVDRCLISGYLLLVGGNSPINGAHFPVIRSERPSGTSMLPPWLSCYTKCPTRVPVSVGVKIVDERFCFCAHGRAGRLYLCRAPTGFVAAGRNLLFLCATKSPTVWRVTPPMYATCLALADAPPDYPINGSDSSIRRGLVAEIETAIYRATSATIDLHSKARNRPATRLRSMRRTSLKCSASMRVE